MRFLDLFRTKERADWAVCVPKEVAETIFKEISSNYQACRTSEIPQGYGEFGLDPTNPIPTFGVPSNEAYLKSLRTTNGDVLNFRRLQSITVQNINKPVDEYEILDYAGQTIAHLYLSPYHWVTSRKTPKGFLMNGRSGNPRSREYSDLTDSPNVH